MFGSRTFKFTDPYPYQAAIRGAELEVIVTTAGDFRAELMQIDLPRLRISRGRESLPRIFHGAVDAKRVAINFLTAADQPAIYHRGRAVSPGEIIVNDLTSMHRRTNAPCQWGAMSLTREDLAAAGKAITGHELTAPWHAHVIRPSPPLMSRLMRLHVQAAQLARTAPDTFASQQASRALDQALVHAMIMCLTESMPFEMNVGTHRYSAIMGRLEEFLTANLDQPLYLAEICAATGASDHTLRSCCQEYLGMSAIHYLWLRRMHMTHQALVLANSATTTVTEIATNCGFWELGRFSVEYRALFGEAPSVSLRRPPDDRPIAWRGRSRKSPRVDRPPGRSSRVPSIYSSTASPECDDTVARQRTCTS
jgi:AraC-like DNA-binding protein